VEEYSTVRKATDNSTAHEHCVPDNKGWRHTLRKFNTYCFLTATMITRMRLTVTLYLHIMVTSSVKKDEELTHVRFRFLSILHATPNNFSFMKSKQRRRAGHLAGLGEMRNSYTFFFSIHAPLL